jgi:hypothetical protein
MLSIRHPEWVRRLVVSGVNISPEDVAIFHALRRAELCVLPGTHHGTFSSRPEWLNPILGAFLDRP